MTKIENWAGQAVYTPAVLKIYDVYVLGFTNHLVWRCPTKRLVTHYKNHISNNHLEVGVGSGYFLEKCRLETPLKNGVSKQRIGLMDMNPNTLEYTANRIAHCSPEVYQQDIFKPINETIEKFDSVAINFVLHCLAGKMAKKAAVFDNLADLMTKDAVLFGSTVMPSSKIKRGNLIKGMPPKLSAGKIKQWLLDATFLAKPLMQIYNELGIFSNENDTASALYTELSKRFKNVSMEVVGSVVLFSAQQKL